jgi:hypothetical protein
MAAGLADRGYPGNARPGGGTVDPGDRPGEVRRPRQFRPGRLRVPAHSGGNERRLRRHRQFHRSYSLAGADRRQGLQHPLHECCGVLGLSKQQICGTKCYEHFKTSHYRTVGGGQRGDGLQQRGTRSPSGCLAGTGGRIQDKCVMPPANSRPHSSVRSSKGILSPAGPTPPVGEAMPDAIETPARNSFPPKVSRHSLLPTRRPARRRSILAELALTAGGGLGIYPALF